MIAEKNGFTNVANEYFKRGATDFYPVATRLARRESGSDRFRRHHRPRPVAAAARRCANSATRARSCSAIPTRSRSSRSPAPDAAEGTLLFDTLVDPQNAQQKELQEWWLKKYGPPFPTFAYSVWDTPFILARACARRSRPIR